MTYKNQNYHRRWYQENKIERREKQNRYNQAKALERKRLLVDLLGGACVRCGYNEELVALDFDHIDPRTKAFKMGYELARKPMEALLIEVAKCQLLCANCHRIKTWKGGENATYTDNEQLDSGDRVDGDGG